MKGTIEELAAKLDGLNLWSVVDGRTWAVKPQHTVFPYFCTAIRGGGPQVKVRFLILEGWQTMHDFVRTRVDRFFGYYLTPMEMPHFELVVLDNGQFKLFRHDPCFVPHEVTPNEQELCA